MGRPYVNSGVSDASSNAAFACGSLFSTVEPTSVPPPTATLALTPNLEATVAATNQATQQAIKQTLGTPNSASPASLSTLTLTPTATLTTTQPTLIPLAAYLATQTGVLGVESEFRQVLLQLDNVRRTIDALQAQSASNWANLVDVVPYRDQVTRIGILLRRAGERQCTLD